MEFISTKKTGFIRLVASLQPHHFQAVRGHNRAATAYACALTKERTALISFPALLTIGNLSQRIPRFSAPRFPRIGSAAPQPIHYACRW